MAVNLEQKREKKEEITAQNINDGGSLADKNIIKAGRERHQIE